MKKTMKFFEKVVLMLSIMVMVSVGVIYYFTAETVTMRDEDFVKKDTVHLTEFTEEGVRHSCV